MQDAGCPGTHFCVYAIATGKAREEGISISKLNFV